MGLFRKTSSLLTLGAVDFRSDRERTARYTRQTRNAVRAQRPAPAPVYYTPPPQPVAPPPGWYGDPGGAPCARWWDGRQWTNATRP